MYQLEVENIKCSGCANSIERALLPLNKVEKIQVDTEKGLVLVSGDADRELIVESLAALGYPEKGSNTIFCRAKSFVSCALGRMY